MNYAIAIKIGLYILPLIAIAIGAYNFKNNENAKGGWLIIVGVFTLIFDVSNHIQTARSDNKKDSTITSLILKVDTLGSSIKMLKDTLQFSRDALLKVGLKVDERTKRIEVVDEKIFSGIQTLLGKQTNVGEPDSTNFLVYNKNDTLYISPKEGVWPGASFYIYTDTLHFKEDETDTPIPGGYTSSDFKLISIHGRSVLINRHYDFSEAIKPNQPAIISLKKHPIKTIIFGSDVSLAKRYLYENGKATWFPEK